MGKKWVLCLPGHTTQPRILQHCSHHPIHNTSVTVPCYNHCHIVTKMLNEEALYQLLEKILIAIYSKKCNYKQIPISCYGTRQSPFHWQTFPKPHYKSKFKAKSG